MKKNRLFCIVSFKSTCFSSRLAYIRRIISIWLNVCCVSAFILFSLFYCEIVKAETIGLSVNTSAIMLRLESEKKQDFSFTVKNETSSQQTLHLQEKDIVIGNENEVTFLDIQDGPSSWVTFEQNDFLLEANQSQLIRATFQIPVGQVVGNIQMMTLVSFESGNIVNPLDGQRVNGNIGIYTIFSGNDAQNASGKFEKMTCSKFINESISINAVYLNNGDVQFVPIAKIKFFNLFTKNSRETFLDRHFVFPGKKVTLKQNFSGFSSFGIYSVKVSILDGNGQISEKTSYAVGKLFPIVLLLGIIFFWFLARLLMIARAKNSRKMLVREAIRKPVENYRRMRRL